MSILDEIEEEMGFKPVKCTVCQWLNEQPSDERAEWEEALAPSSGKMTTAIHKVMVRHGYDRTVAAVNSHRADHRHKGKE